MYHAHPEIANNINHSTKLRRKDRRCECGEKGKRNEER